jgi:hypothetical protein
VKSSPDIAIMIIIKMPTGLRMFNEEAIVDVVIEQDKIQISLINQIIHEIINEETTDVYHSDSTGNITKLKNFEEAAAFLAQKMFGAEHEKLAEFFNGLKLS